MHRLSFLSATALSACLCAASAPACAEEARVFNIPAGSLRDALNLFAAQSNQQILFSGDLVAGQRSAGLSGAHVPSVALNRLLAGTDLMWRETRPGVIFLGAYDAEVDEVTRLEEVIVTGSLLRSSGPLSSPVVVMDRDALDRRGFGTVAEALTDLPQNYAGTATPVVQLAGSDRAGSNSVYATGVNLRGLGATSTLVLVNGRRLAGTGLRGDFGDVSALPSGAVERVDVLLDGASALYGADAVAGVVNVIMRRTFDGQETRLRGAAARGGAEGFLVSHLAGRTWSSGAAYLSYEYQTTNGLSAYDRAYTADGDLRRFGGTDRRNFYGTPGNILAFNAATSSYGSQYAIRPTAGGTAQGRGDFVAGAANLQSSTLGADLVPSIERHSVYGRIAQSVGDRFDLSADVRYNRRAHDIAGAASAGIFTVTRANPWFVSPTGSASHAIGYAFLAELGPTRAKGSSESLGVTLGARYALTPEWSLDGYVALARERGEAGVFNRVHSRFANEALGVTPDDPATPFSAAADGYLNLFGDGQANSRAVLDFIGQGYSIARDESRATSANLLAEGPLLTLPGGELRLAFGLQHRQELFDTQTVSFASTAVPIHNRKPQRERSISAVFAEVRAPLIGPAQARPGLRRLEISLAGRFEAYDDFGDTANPKLGLVWSPGEDLNLRASWGTSFRAASLPQTHDSEAASGAFLNRADGSRALALLRIGGNPDLKPETAETVTVGFDYAPRGGPRLSASYFDTRFTDRIARPVSDNSAFALIDPSLAPFVRLVDPANKAADLALVESYSSLPGFPSLYPATAYAAIVDVRWVNTGAVKVRGFDLSGRYPFAIGGHDFTLEASASYVLDFETRATPTAPARQVVGLVGYPVDLRARTGVTWSHGDLGGGVHWNHVADYRDLSGRGISAWNTVDAQASWRPSSRFEGLRLALTVQNLFDEDPPFYDSPTGYGFDPGQGGLLGRVVALQLIQRW